MQISMKQLINFQTVLQMRKIIIMKELDRKKNVHNLSRQVSRLSPSLHVAYTI